MSALILLAVAGSSAALAAVPRQEPSRFDRLVLHDAVARLGIAAERPDALPDFEAERAAWASFRALHGQDWSVWVDRRSGATMLAQGPGIAWFDPEGPTPSLEDLEAMARGFVERHATALGVRGAELRLDTQASGSWDADRLQIVFERIVDGVPVEGQRFRAFVVRGRLVSFGADRWARVREVPRPRYGVETTRELLYAYMGVLPTDAVDEIESGTLVLTAAPPAESPDATRWVGPTGAGISSRLVRRFVLRVAGEPGTWVGKVDALTGEIVALYDDDKYAQVKGGIYPVASDGDCARGGCEVADMPLPYANLTVNGLPATANDAGIFDCSGGSAVTSLVGPYVRISDVCGAVNESVVCDEDLDLGEGPAGQTNCAINPGESAGNTHASRSAFYTVNRIKEKGRHWLPSNGFLNGQVQVNVNVNSTCNATWGGQLNMYRAGNGCRNTGETAGVLNHEFGHGFDQNDGGGYDNPSEAYADVIAILSDRASCVGRGFFEADTCSGYGDTCLSCSGIRDMDWDARTRHTPATPQNFTDDLCGGGGGPCGREVHCESYPPSETLYDLAARDLPASGLDPVTSWQLAERLFYRSRNGSGGDAFNCALPSSDGCNTGGWFNTMRIADDDDGNLANGTPHAAAIYAAFDRHNISCGNVTDASNQSTSSCPALATPVPTATNGSGAANLSWAPVTGAASYLVLRTELSCDATQNVVAVVPAPGTSYVDTDLPNGTTFFYRVQAQGSNSACESAVSACVQATPQPFAGTIKLDRPAYSCAGTMGITVIDANIGAPTTTVQVSSTTETAPETVVLTQTSPTSGKYVGTIATQGTGPVAGDGVLSIADGDAISVTYLDADDGQGGTNLLREAAAAGDCRPLVVSQVRTTGVTDVAATVQWETDESGSSVVHWGEVKPPANLASAPGLVGSHAVSLGGLQACTRYWYSVESQDAAGNVVEDANGGIYHSFETLGNLGNGLQACNSGVVTIDRDVASCTSTLPLTLTDLGLNTSPTLVDTVQVTLTSTTEPTPETVTLTETGVNTSRFTGSISLAPGAPVAGDGVLQAAGGDVLTATYRDGDDGTGSPHVSFDTAVADCAGPGATSIQVVQITDESADVRLEAGESMTMRVDWGLTPSLGSTVSATTPATIQTVRLAPIPECGRFFFRIVATDVYGNARTFDASGAPFEANVRRIPPGVFKDTFETLSGWTLQGEWQIAAPQGKGTSPPDPTTAFEGTKVLGHDLTGLGARPGDYEAIVTERATSPVIDASSLTGGQLRFRRRLSVGEGAIASIDVKRGTQLQTVWTSESTTDTSWSLQTINIAGLADGNPGLQVIFKMKGNASGPGRSSWNLDRLIVNSASQPAFEACGACAGAPTFAGAAAATDADPCGDTGITVRWSTAPAWGTGAAGTYAVYRSSDPGFVPSGANLIASGVAGTSYTDAPAPNGATLYYVVRAENDETCSAGPANGGVTDGNLVRVSGRDDTSQAVPGDLGATLVVTDVNDAHVRLAWTAVAGATSFHVYRSQFAAGPFTKIGSTAASFYEDRDQLANSTSWYYLVRGANACGIEGP